MQPLTQWGDSSAYHTVCKMHYHWFCFPCRNLHNRSKTANQQMVTSSTPPQEQFVPLSAESIFKLDEMKVFQDEQIIQVNQWQAFVCYLNLLTHSTFPETVGV